MNKVLLAILLAILITGSAHAQGLGTWVAGSDCNAVTFSGPLPGSQVAQPFMVDSHGNLCVTGGSGAGGTGALVPLDVATVTTGGTAVTALAAGNRTHGGWLQNPSTASVNLCINELAAASGTTSAGSLTCVVPGQTYILAASPNAVSVVSSDSAHAFSGYGEK